MRRPGTHHRLGRLEVEAQAGRPIARAVVLVHQDRERLAQSEHLDQRPRVLGHVQGQALAVLNAGWVPGRHPVALDIDHQDFDARHARHGVGQQLHEREVARVTYCRHQRSCTGQAQQLGVGQLPEAGDLVEFLCHHPARDGRLATMAGAPISAILVHDTPPAVTSNTRGSGLVALGSSMVTRNLRPFTSFR